MESTVSHILGYGGTTVSLEELRTCSTNVLLELSDELLTTFSEELLGVSEEEQAPEVTGSIKKYDYSAGGDIDHVYKSCRYCKYNGIFPVVNESGIDPTANHERGHRSYNIGRKICNPEQEGTDCLQCKPKWQKHYFYNQS